MVRYYRAKDEHGTVIMTERLGQTKSPLMVDELLEALKDPRFNVRFEAIISIARMSPDPRLVEALISILHGTELSLSVIAAWALGRIGDEHALPTLREGLNSEYRSIRAHCARALGTLKDTSMIPELVSRLETETDKGLQIAYAAALGNLRAKAAVDILLVRMKNFENEGARLELALSLARVAGDEQHFIRLLRQIRHDKGTAISQSVSALKRKFGKSASKDTDMGKVLFECADIFARDNVDQGAAALSRLIELSTETPSDEASAKILRECATRLNEFGGKRIEYIILALHVLEVG
jgi:hypothetical protein